MSRVRAVRTLTNASNTLVIHGLHVVMVIASIPLVAIHANVKLDTFTKNRVLYQIAQGATPMVF